MAERHADRTPIERRWAEEPAEDGAPRLFRTMLRPGLSPSQLARVRARLLAAPAAAEEVARRGAAAMAALLSRRWVLVPAALLAGLAIGVLVRQRPAERTVAAGPCAALPLPVAGAAHAVLLGPGAARLGGPAVALDEGTLLV